MWGLELGRQGNDEMGKDASRGEGGGLHKMKSSCRNGRIHEKKRKEKKRVISKISNP